MVYAGKLEQISDKRERAAETGRLRRATHRLCSPACPRNPTSLAG